MSQTGPEFEHEADVPNSIHLIASGLLWVGGIASVLIASFGTADAVSSVLRGRPLAGVVEFTQLALVTLVFTAQPYVLVSRAHIRLDLIKYSRGSVGDWLSRILTYGTALLSYGLIAYSSWPSFWSSVSAREATEGIIALPVYPVKGLLFLGAAISFAIIVFLIARSIYRGAGNRTSHVSGSAPWTP
jgi:TRAP-type C4-dicarboxylate transport system permease small subunit